MSGIETDLRIAIAISNGTCCIYGEVRLSNIISLRIVLVLPPLMSIIGKWSEGQKATTQNLNTMESSKIGHDDFMKEKIYILNECLTVGSYSSTKWFCISWIVSADLPVNTEKRKNNYLASNIIIDLCMRKWAKKIAINRYQNKIYIRDKYLLLLGHWTFFLGAWLCYYSGHYSPSRGIKFTITLWELKIQNRKFEKCEQNIVLLAPAAEKTLYLLTNHHAVPKAS